MAEELQREAEARSAALAEGGESDKAVQEAGPDPRAGRGRRPGQQRRAEVLPPQHPAMLSINILLRMQPLVLCKAASLLSFMSLAKVLARPSRIITESVVR